ncbi:MAG: EamA family transporter RarD [Pseudorhodobacter sp.]
MHKVAPLENEDSLRGFGFAASAYFLWGILPVYLKAMAHIPALEVVAHRAVWSLPFAGLLLIVLRRTADLKEILKSPRMLAMATLTAVLVAANWGIYVWAIANDNALDAALGYFINPLFSIFLGAVLLGEKLGNLQKAAIALAVLAVVLLTLQLGRLPLVAIGLTLTWGGYAYFKKMLPIGPNQGFFLEILILTLPALCYIFWLGWTGQGSFFKGSTTDNLLLICSGAVTAIPLALYANGAKLLRLSTIAIMQYIPPTLVFLVAIFVFREPFGQAQFFSFALIWAALGLYSFSIMRHRGG